MDFIYCHQRSPRRFTAVNAVKLRDLRLSLGWSQTELARRSGYSARLIRKAESGGSLNYETIEDLAVTLSTIENKIDVELLLFNSKEVVQQFVAAYDLLGAKCVDRMKPYFDTDIQLHCSADSETVPFAGTWTGASGIAKFFEAFLETYNRRKQSIRATYLIGETSVAARFTEVLYYRGQELPPLRVNWYCEFKLGKITYIEYEYDQYQAWKNLRSHIRGIRNS